MSDPSREGHPHHPRATLKIWRLQASDASQLFQYLHDKDIWPVPREADLALFLGRKDAVAYGASQDGRMKGVLSGVVDQATVRLVHILIEGGSVEPARRLSSELETFAKGARASAIFAQVVRDSDAHRSLAASGYAEDLTEGDVVAGHVVITVDLIKIL